MSEMPDEGRMAFNRRRFVQCLSASGLGATLLPGALAAVAQDAEEISVEMLKAAAAIAGLSFKPEELEAIASQLNGRRSFLNAYERLRREELPNSVSPALVFNPLPPGFQPPRGQRSVRPAMGPEPSYRNDEELAFLPVTALARLIRSRRITSTELTQVYLSRLKRLDPKLHCVITLTEELALAQARRADEEIKAGRYRGPLHGIPWGAKDLLVVPGFPTTWGASPYKDQVLDGESTVYRRLTDAGAVLAAKLTMGALAQGDRWFGGRTRNPWNTEQGSSGSSAGPGSATAAGLVGFSIGTETRGSIISPSARCGVTGMRPTFGRVSRHGAMALSWSMDKIGPMCRSAEDCALVLAAIHGPDGFDRSLFEASFGWEPSRDPRTLRVGYLKSLEREVPDDDQRPQRAAFLRRQRELDLAALDVIRGMGVELRPLELPEMPSRALGFILVVEAAAAFDELTRSGRDESMLAEPESSRWPSGFNLHRFVPAVEYLQANRVRTRLIEKMAEFFSDLDLFVGSDLALTNLTGHPEISLPHGFSSQGTPLSLRFTGKLFGDEEILLLAHAYQSRTDHHLKHPSL